MYRIRTFLVALLALTSLLSGVAGAQPADDRLITETTMGPGTVGSTPAELEAQLGPDYTVAAATTFVDTEGFEVTSGGVAQFLAFHVVGEGPELNFLVTDNAEYQLDNGIGPGTTIADAAVILGSPTVAFNTESESREFATFEDFTGTRVQFQVVGPDGAEMAGNYPESSSSFNETTDIKDGATIQRIWISCLGDECPEIPSGGGTLPDTGAGDGTLPLVMVAAVMLLAGVMVAATGRRTARSAVAVAAAVAAHPSSDPNL